MGIIACASGNVGDVWFARRVAMVGVSESDRDGGALHLFPFRSLTQRLTQQFSIFLHGILAPQNIF